MDGTIEEVGFNLEISTFTTKILFSECEVQATEENSAGIWRVRCKKLRSKGGTTSTTQGHYLRQYLYG
jgi:hypothetical protein